MHRFRNILFVAIPEADDAGALERALRLAESHGAHLTVVDVRPAEVPAVTSLPRGLTPELLQETVAEASGEALQQYEEVIADRVPCTVRTLIGIGFVEVIRTVLKDGHDLVVKVAQAHGRGSRATLGSFDLHLLRKCPVPVWIDRPDGSRGYRRVLAAVDLDPDAVVDPRADSLNRRILEAGAAQALADGAEFHVLHAWHAPYEGLLRTRGVFRSDADEEAYIDSERQWRQGAAEQLLGALQHWLAADDWERLKPRMHLRHGAPGEVIPAAVEELRADLLTMGTVGRVGLAGLIIGNTAETILEQIGCSVLAVKPPGFRTPVKLDG